MLTNVAPVATNAVTADITEIANGNGYTTGGLTVTAITNSQTSGTDKLVGTGPTLTASGGTVGPFRYVVLRNSTPAAGPLISWYDYGSSVTLNTGETFQTVFDPSLGILQLA